MTKDHHTWLMSSKIFLRKNTIIETKLALYQYDYVCSKYFKFCKKFFKKLYVEPVNVSYLLNII